MTSEEKSITLESPALGSVELKVQLPKPYEHEESFRPSPIVRSWQRRVQMERAKILIVDDDPNLRHALRTRLRANHYDTVQASDGYSAIAMAQKEQPGLIILDLGLPAGDGFVVLKRLQESDILSSIPVIVLTARDAKFNEQKTLQAGATAFFQKPPNICEFLDMIRAALPNASAVATLPS
jgi:DNA-binding response OmpR family regulator